MEKTFEVTESFIREAHGAACRDWKRKIEAKFPIFSPQPMWYTQKSLPNWLCHLNSDGSGYGFDMKGDWKDNFVDMNDYIKRNCSPATAEQVESALRGEAIKRGFVLGARFTSHVNGGKYVADVSEPNFWNKYSRLDDECRFNMSMYAGAGGIIYKNGEWAKIIGEPIQAGKWYKTTDPSKKTFIFVTKSELGRNCGFGIDGGGNWTDYAMLDRDWGCQLATTKEVVSTLKEEAMKRGFVEGITFTNRYINSNQTLRYEFTLSMNGTGINANSTGFGTFTIFETKGDEPYWAEIINDVPEDPTPEEIKRVLDYLK